MLTNVLKSNRVFASIYSDDMPYLVQISKSKVAFKNNNFKKTLFSFDIKDAINVAFTPDYSYCAIMAKENTIYFVDCTKQTIVHTKSFCSRVKVDKIHFINGNQLVVVCRYDFDEPEIKIVSYRLDPFEEQTIFSIKSELLRKVESYENRMLLYCIKPGKHDVENIIYKLEYVNNAFLIDTIENLFKVADKFGDYQYSFNFVDNRFVTVLKHRIALIDFYDSNYNYIATDTIRDRIRDIRWVDNGNYLLLDTSKGFVLLNGKNYKKVAQYNVLKTTVHCSFDNNYISFWTVEGNELWKISP